MPAGRRVLLLAAAAFLLSACAGRQWVIREAAETVEAGLPALEADDDVDLLVAALPANIKLLEILLSQDPGNRDLRVLLSRLYGAYAFVGFEEKIEACRLTGGCPEALPALESQAARLYRRGLGYALDALEIGNPGLTEALGDLTRSVLALQTLRAKDAPALFWYGFNLAGAVQHGEQNIETLSRAYLVEASMHRVLALDPGYFHGAAHLVLLVYHAARPPALGGDPRKAEVHYEALRSLHDGNYLLADFFVGRYLLFYRGETEEFLPLLNRIREAPPRELPFKLFNRVAALRAARCLEAADALFE